MKSSDNTSTKRTRVARRPDRGVPFEEMRRLMRVYGSTKCLRKRQPTGGKEENTKVESVKRKFYRWFPDLEERFERDEEGFFRPKYGHEFELRYRKEMRTKDGETLAKKRANRRKDRKSGVTESKGSRKSSTRAFKPPPTFVRTVSNVNSTDGSEEGTASPTNLSDSARVTPIVVTPRGESHEASIGILTIDKNHDPLDLSANITAGTEPVDRSFIADGGIFDDVEKNFYGASLSTKLDPANNGIELITCSSGSSVEQGTGSSSESDDSPAFDDILGQSIEDCCDEILGSPADDNDSVSGYLIDVMSS